MKVLTALVLSGLTLGLAAPAMAQQAKKKRPAKTATEIVVTNARQATLTDFQLSNEQGLLVGALKAPLASGKKVSIKLSKGAPCTLTVMALFDDEFENAGGIIDGCKDKNVRFAN
jgi:hypothetical protein